jgi:rhamnogalacturonan endolyase
MNFRIYWDGDLYEELLDGNKIDKWNGNGTKRLATLSGNTCNSTKNTPNLQADILGDWREEVVARTPDSSELRIYVSTIPTDYRINCLMEDIPYRLSTAAQNVGYNQPSEPGFYLGPDKSVNKFLK